MTRIVIDENLPADLVVVFNSAGIEAVHVYHSNLRARPDRDVWIGCLEKDAAIATKDADFVDLATLRDEGQVVLFAVGNMRLRDVTRFASEHVDSIRSFMESSERVLVLRP